MRRYAAIPVGMTPISRYSSWEEHRLAINQDAAYQLRKRSFQGAKRVPAV